MQTMFKLLLFKVIRFIFFSVAILAFCEYVQLNGAHLLQFELSHKDNTFCTYPFFCFCIFFCKKICFDAIIFMLFYYNIL